MKFLPLLVLLASSFQDGESLNFLAYNPMFGRSHTTFVGRLADVLVEAGHNVTVIGPVVDSSLGSYGCKKAKIIVIPQAEEIARYEKELFVPLMEGIWKSKGMGDFLKTFSLIGEVFIVQCRATLSHPGLLETLRSQNWDAAFGEGTDMCGISLFHALGIDKVAITSSVSSTEGFGFATGLPSFPSYVPGFGPTTGEKMSFQQRIKNTIGLLVGRMLFPSKFESLTPMMREKFGPDFPSGLELLQAPSLMFINNEPLIDFPKPTIHKIIDIGGISVSGGHSPLNKTWSDIFNLRKQTVLLSFGTVARSYIMPESYKKTIRDTFAKFPDVTFIWKYEKPEHRISEGIKNIIESTFVPQNDMLYDPRLSLFITHCGQGSTTESTTAGVPLIVIPVMGDQMRNAQIIRRIGSGLALQKEQLDGGDALEKALREVLGNPRYKERAAYIGRTIRDRPFSPRETFVRNMEFVAKHGPLRQLDHYGLQLNFFQFYLIDVFAFLGAIVIGMFAIIFITLRFAVRKCFFTKTETKKKGE